MHTVTRTFRVLRRLTVLNLGVALAYRGDFVLYMLAGMATPVISLLVWRAALASGAPLPVDRQYLTTYFVLLGVVAMLASSWIAPYLADKVRNGRLSVWLVRPAPSHLNGISNNLVEKVLKVAWYTPVIALLWWVFRDPMQVPTELARWALFMLSVALAAVIAYAVDVLIGSLGFWLDDVRGLYQAQLLLAKVLSGAVVPLALMPQWARGFLDVQPFRFMVSFPLEIMVGQLSGTELATGLGLQAGYAGLAVGGAVAVWRAGLRSYAAVGA